MCKNKLDDLNVCESEAIVFWRDQKCLFYKRPNTCTDHHLVEMQRNKAMDSTWYSIPSGTARPWMRQTLLRRRSGCGQPFYVVNGGGVRPKMSNIFFVVVASNNIEICVNSLQSEREWTRNVVSFVRTNPHNTVAFNLAKSEENVWTFTADRSFLSRNIFEAVVIYY